MTLNTSADYNCLGVDARALINMSETIQETVIAPDEHVSTLGAMRKRSLKLNAADIGGQRVFAG